MDVRRFPRGQDAPSENPAGSANPAQRAGREGGVCFFAPGFFAHAKKGDSRRHGAKALDLCVAVVRQEEEQEQLAALAPLIRPAGRSEEHTSELQSLMRISYAVFCLKKKTQKYTSKKHDRRVTSK